MFPVILCLLPTAFCLLVLASHPGRVGLKSLLLLPAVFSQVPLQPLNWLSPPPRRETFRFDYSVGQVEGDIYLPGPSGRYGALLVLLGARPLGRDEPILVRFAEGVSRAGAVVMIPASSNLAAGKVLPEEVDAIVEDVALLRSHDDVDPNRIGILGFSVGGSLAVLASADPRLAGQLAFVNTFGGYNDARDLTRAVSTQSLEYAGVNEAWQPHQLTVWVVARQIVDTLPPGADRDVLEELYVREEPSAREEVGRLSPLGRVVLELLDGLSPAGADEALALLPEATQERLARISPAAVLDRVHTPLLVMHDRADGFVPFTESERLVAGAPAGAVELFTEFELFSHVVPDRPPSSPALVVELAKLCRQMYRMLLYIL